MKNLNIEKIQWNQVEKIKIENDPVLFYGLVTSSFLESTANVYATRLADYFQDNTEIVSWFRQTWQLEELNHGALMRMYIQTIWPQYDWEYAYNYFYQHYTSRPSLESLTSSRALMMLNLCVTETEAALSYKALANYINEPIFKKIIGFMYADEVRHYKSFSKYFGFYNKQERLNLVTLAKTIMKRQRHIAHEDLAISIKFIPTGWHSSSPFGKITPYEIIHGIELIMNQHFSYNLARKMLFKPLGKRNLAQILVINLLEIAWNREVRSMRENFR